MNAYLPPIVAASSTDGALALLAALSDPSKSKSLLETITAERERVEAASQKLAGLQASAAALDKAKAEHEREKQKHAEEHDASVAELTQRYQRYDADQAALVAERNKLAAERTAFDVEKRQHADRLAQVAQLKKVLS
jgi:chromosome segregation ATPase